MEQPGFHVRKTISIQQDFAFRDGERTDVRSGLIACSGNRSGLRGPDFRAVSALVVQEAAPTADQMHPGRTAEWAGEGSLHLPYPMGRYWCVGQSFSPGAERSNFGRSVLLKKPSWRSLQELAAIISAPANANASESR